MAKRKIARRKPVRRRRRMGGFDLGTDLNLAVFVAIAVGGYMLYNYFEGDSSSSTSSGSSGVNLSTVQSDIAADTAAGAGPNYDSTQYQTWATAIASAGSLLYPAGADNATVLAIMDQMDNDADIYSLIYAFGSQWFTAAFQTMTLPIFITSAFTAAMIQSFNQQLAYNGVTYQFSSTATP